jgi:hypothetical protein
MIPNLNRDELRLIYRDSLPAAKSAIDILAVIAAGGPKNFRDPAVQKITNEAPGLLAFG